MKSKTIRELRVIAQDKGLRRYFKLTTAELVALLLEQTTKEIPTPPPKSKGKKRRPELPVRKIPSPQGMDEFEK